MTIVIIIIAAIILIAILRGLIEDFFDSSAGQVILVIVGLGIVGGVIFGIVKFIIAHPEWLIIVSIAAGIGLIALIRFLIERHKKKKEEKKRRLEEERLRIERENAEKIQNARRSIWLFTEDRIYKTNTIDENDIFRAVLNGLDIGNRSSDAYLLDRSAIMFLKSTKSGNDNFESELHDIINKASSKPMVYYQLKGRILETGAYTREEAEDFCINANPDKDVNEIRSLVSNILSQLINERIIAKEIEIPGSGNLYSNCSGRGSSLKKRVIEM